VSTRRLFLVGGFELRVGHEAVELPAASQRVLAFLALQDRKVNRSQVAGNLWPEATEARAAANLRSALWRLRQPDIVVGSGSSHLMLHADTWVDVRVTTALAVQLIAEPADRDVVVATDPRTFAGELLPDMWDAWLVVERERVRQLHLHALERLCELLVDRGRHAQAVMAGIGAVEMDPLRESANRVLIRAHLAEGNRVEAIRQFDAFRRLLHDELGLLPSAELIRLVGDADVTPPHTPVR
jgi:DNA-binding SARP family transcriptional activator